MTGNCNIQDFYSSSVIGFEVTVRGNNTDGQAQLRFRGNDSSGIQSLDPNTFNLANDTWYTLTMSISEGAVANDWDLSAAIYFQGGALIESHSATLTNSSLLSSANLFAGFANGRSGALAELNRGGIAADNFIVIRSLPRLLFSHWDCSPWWHVAGIPAKGKADAPPKTKCNALFKSAHCFRGVRIFF